MDLQLSWNNDTGTADIAFVTGDAVRDAGLTTAIILSLFTDQVADEAYPLAPGEDPRGWWGNTYGDVPLGSRLWELARAKKYDNTTLPLRARDYCAEALQWLLDQGIASKLDIAVEWLPRPRSALAISITVHKPDGTSINNRFDWVWNA